jgi:hypothetical protein
MGRLRRERYIYADESSLNTWSICSLIPPPPTQDIQIRHRVRRQGRYRSALPRCSHPAMTAKPLPALQVTNLATQLLTAPACPLPSLQAMTAKPVLVPSGCCMGWDGAQSDRSGMGSRPMENEGEGGVRHKQ